MISKQKRYLNKLKNDLDENHFDLLINHLSEIGVRIKIFDEDAESLISFLEEAINLLKTKIQDRNKQFIYRYILICANKILFLDKSREDIKQLKKDLIEDYNHLEEKESGKIPIDYQLSELRITYDPHYLLYLTKSLIKQEKYVEAFFCYEAIHLIEPDNDIIDQYWDFFEKLFPKVELEKAEFNEPKEMILILDANVVISKILENIPEFNEYCSETYDLEKLGNFNKFLVFNSVIKEVKEHIDILCYNKFRHSRTEKRDLERRILKKLNKFIEKYIYSEKLDLNLNEVKAFYLKFPSKLRIILNWKVSHEKTLSHKLRRMVKRYNLLPEEGDLCFLANCIALKQHESKNIGILSNDSDFQYFAKEIKEKFDIEVLSELN